MKKTSSFTQKREKIDNKIEKIRSELRVLCESPLDKDELGIVVFFSEELEDHENLMARVFKDMDTLNASVFPVTEKIMKSLERLVEKYEKIKKLEKKSKKTLKNEKKQKHSLTPNKTKTSSHTTLTKKDSAIQTSPEIPSPQNTPVQPPLPHISSTEKPQNSIPKKTNTSAPSANRTSSKKSSPQKKKIPARK